MKRRIISFVLTTVLLLSAVSVFAFAAHPLSGAANNDATATWSFDEATGTITFVGDDNAGLSLLTVNEKKELAPKIKKAVFAEGIDSVSSNTFENCVNLTEVVLPSTLNTINGRAFYGCTALTAVTVPAAVSYIGDAAFGMSSAAVTIAAGNNYYKNVGNLIYTADNTTLLYYPAFVQGDEFVIPAGTVDIDEAFLGNKYLKKVTIPATVLTARYAFQYCTALKTVNFSEGMVLIPSNVCYEVASLETVTLPSTIKEIEYGAFYQSGLKSVIVPEGVTKIGDFVFYRCEALAEVKFPSTLENVGYDVVGRTAYYNDASKWENNVLYLGTCVIDTTYDLKGNYTIKDGTTLIAEYAFSHAKITSVTIPNSVKYICDNAFYGAASLASVNSTGEFIWVGRDTVLETPYAANELNWVNGGLYIGKALVLASEEIVSLTVVDGTAVIADRAAAEREKLEFVAIPGSVKSIGDFAFYDCDALKTVILNSGIVRIGEWAFMDADAVEELVIPEGVKFLGEDAFASMNALKKLTIPASLEQIAMDPEYPTQPWSSINLELVTVNGTYAQMVNLGIQKYVDNHISYGVKYVFVGGYGNITPSWAMKDTSTIFKDVIAGKWYKNAVDYAYNNGFISGMTADSFGLNTSITRGMFVTIIARIAGADTSTAANKAAPAIFADVAAGKYYSAAVVWAKQNGVASGKSATTFEPNTAISRQELCVMISNFAKFMKIDLIATEPEIAFTDGGAIAKWAKTAVVTCQKADIVNGYTVGAGAEFRPANTATRAEAAQILYKFHKDFVAK